MCYLRCRLSKLSNEFLQCKAELKPFVIPLYTKSYLFTFGSLQFPVNVVKFEVRCLPAVEAKYPVTVANACEPGWRTFPYP